MYYVAKLTPEADGGYSVEFPDIPGCITQGDTLEDALTMAKEALELVMEEYLDGRMLPDPNTDEDKANGLYAIEVDQELADLIIDAIRARAYITLQLLDDIGFFDRSKNGAR
jgi:antitoxin HicB